LNIKAVLFDADGVVIHPRMQFSRYLEEAFAITPQMTRPFFSGVFNECLVGTADLLTVLPPFLEEWDWPGSPADFLRLWLAKDDCPNLRLLAAIQRLRRAGLRCGLATLQEKNRAAYMRSNMGFSEQFDHLYFSCELGSPKPAAQFFHKIEASLHLNGDEILFWDDDPHNIIAARGMGWYAEDYHTFSGYLNRLPLYHLPI
jgi:putative hydrolase of the HAD superfamily